MGGIQHIWIVNASEWLAAPSAVLPSPTPLRITAIALESNNIRVTWSTSPGATNSLQIATGAWDGSYQTNGFADVFTVTNAIGTGTNYLDLAGATNFPSRYYRVRLVP
jgi:hypothetical protein